MKNKLRIVACCLAAMLLCSMAGCQLAQKGMGTAVREDRLIGVFITTEDLGLSDIDSGMADSPDDLINNLKVEMDGGFTLGGNDQTNQKRLYAKLKKKAETDETTGETYETEGYVFDGVKGISYFCPILPATSGLMGYIDTVEDDAISDVKNSVKGDTENYSLSLEGTVYVLPSSTDCCYYLNPVYQSADGRVYTTESMGFSITGIDCTTQSIIPSHDGEKSGETLDATYTTTENGKATSYSTSVKINFEVVNPPTKIAVLQMDQDSIVLSRTEYAPGSLPKAITPEQRTDYIVVETTKNDSSGAAQVTRSLYGKDATALETFSRRADGIFVKQETQVNWAK